MSNQPTQIREGELRKLWDKLPEEYLRQRRLRKAYRILHPVIQEQLQFLELLEKSDTEKKHAGHVYVFNAARNFWDNVTLAFKMGQDKKLRNFVFYPVRTCMETLMRFIYFCEKEQSEKDIIAAKEELRIYARLYRRAELNNLDNRAYALSYEEISRKFTLQVALINDVVDRELDPFPPMKDLCEQSGMKEPENLYFLYQSLCEAIVTGK